MVFITPENIITLGILFIGFLAANFISIHLMANLILYHGSSRRKSLRISSELALLSTTFAFIAILARNVFGVPAELSQFILLLAVLGSYAVVVEATRVWYIRREYETTWLYAFVVAEGLMIFLQMAFLVLREAVLLWM